MRSLAAVSIRFDLRPPSLLGPPQIQSMMLGDGTEVCVGRQHRQLDADTEMREERVDRSDLHAVPSTVVAKIRCGDVVIAFGSQKRKRGESIDDRIASVGPSKPLKQFLQNQPGGEHWLIATETTPKLRNFGRDV